VAWSFETRCVDVHLNITLQCIVV